MGHGVYVGRHDAAQELRIVSATIHKVFRMIVANAHVVDKHTHIETLGLLADLIVDLYAACEVHIDYTHLDAELAACKYATQKAGLSQAYTHFSQNNLTYFICHTFKLLQRATYQHQFQSLASHLNQGIS